MIITVDDLEEDERKIVAAAIKATKNAYAPYSKFLVGSACYVSGSKILSASNMENISYGLTICSETSLIAAANSEGKLKHVKKIAVAASNGGKQIDAKEGYITPCGRCRQVILEAANMSGTNIEVLCVYYNYKYVKKISIKELLPYSFGGK